MDEIIKSIKAFLYDRTVSPLFGAFVLAWLTWNYRVVIVVFDSGATFVEKMSFFDAYFADEYQFQIAGYAFQMIGGGHMVHGFLAPALLTWFYIYIYPKLAEPVYFVSLRNLKRLRELKNTQENLRLLTMEESRNLQKEIEQLRYKADEEAANYRARIASLTETINSLESNQNKTKTSNTEKFVAELVGSTSNAKLEKEFDNQLTEEEFEKQLISDYSGSGFAKVLMVESNRNLLTQIIKYFVKHDLTVEMFNILFSLVTVNGSFDKEGLQRMVEKKLSSIEIDLLLKKLEQRELIELNNYRDHIYLTDTGKEMAVESGLTSLAKAR